jgi:putative exosortase-associated protein (TIGR04073 family)
MKPLRQFTLAIVFMALLLVQMPVFAVDYYQQQLKNEQMLKRQIEVQQRQRNLLKSLEGRRYRRQVGDKALNGITNMVSGPLELPKNVINLYNDPDGNIIFGTIGGVIKGSLDATARIMAGFGDLITAPLPTKRVVQPEYIWDDFDQSNTYGKVFRLVDNPKIETPILPAPQPTVVQTPIDDRTEQFSQETNRNLDTMFRKEMMK